MEPFNMTTLKMLLYKTIFGHARWSFLKDVLYSILGPDLAGPTVAA